MPRRMGSRLKKRVERKFGEPWEYGEDTLIYGCKGRPQNLYDFCLGVLGRNAGSMIIFFRGAAKPEARRYCFNTEGWTGIRPISPSAERPKKLYSLKLKGQSPERFLISCVSRKNCYPLYVAFQREKIPTIVKS